MKEIERQNGKLVLGDGEVTGHQHTIREASAKMFELTPDLWQLKLSKPAELLHEKGDTPAEHRTIRLPRGDACVTHKRAYSPEGWTRVVD